MRRPRAGPILALFLALPPAAGAAQSFADPGLGLGVQLALTEGTHAREAFPTGALVARLRLTGGLGIEGLLSYRQAVYQTQGQDALRLTEIPLQVSVLVFPAPWIRVQPYALLGAGYYYLGARPLLPEGDTSHSGGFGLHAGTGLEVRAARRLALHLDGRYVYRDVAEVRALPEPGLRADFWQVGLGVTVLY